MTTEITHGVRVSVETYYQEEHSNPAQQNFLFAYRITIENHSDHTVKLLRRHWFIFDSSGEYNEVEGEGVVGKQPILNPGDEHQYISGSNLKSEMGRMYGTYQMERVEDGKLFTVTIPEFQLMAPMKLN